MPLLAPVMNTVKPASLLQQHKFTALNFLKLKLLPHKIKAYALMTNW